MRSEAEVREFYKQYVYKHAEAFLDGEHDAAQQYFGAAMACGRTIGKDMKRINLDIRIAKEWLKKKRDDEKN